MNILFIKHFFVGFMIYEIPRVSVFAYFPLYTYMILIMKCSLFVITELYQIII